MMVLRCTILLLAVNIVSSDSATTNSTDESTTRVAGGPFWGTATSTASTTVTAASNVTSKHGRNGTFILPHPRFIEGDKETDIDVIIGESSNMTGIDEEDTGSGISNAANGPKVSDSDPKTQGRHPNKIVPSSRSTAPPSQATSSVSTTDGFVINVIPTRHDPAELSIPPSYDRDDPGDFNGTTEAPGPKPVPKKTGNLVVIIPLVCLGIVLLVLVVVLHCQNTRERRRVRQLKVLMRRDARMSGRSTDALWRSDRSCTSRGARSSSSRGARSSSSRGARSSSSRGARSTTSRGARSLRPSQKSYELKELPHCAECHHGAAVKNQTNGYRGGKSCDVTRSDPNILGHRAKDPVEYFLDDELYKTSRTACPRKTQSEPTGLNVQLTFDPAVESPFQRVPNNSPAGSCPTSPHPRFINVTEPDNPILPLAASLSVLDVKWTNNRLYVPPADDVTLSGADLAIHLLASRDVYQDLNCNSIQSSMGPGLDSDFGASAGLSLRIMSSDSSLTGYPATCSGNTGESTESSLTSTVTPTPASSVQWASQGDSRYYQSLVGRETQAQTPLLCSEEHWV